MRTVNFRDDVLWAIAYELGSDPETNFQKNQAYSIAVYINSWVRRLWDVTDWPEWTDITTATPDPGHYVSWDIPVPGPNDLTPVLQIGKVLKVYLTDPRLTWTPVETPFRLYGRGIHCGFEHGPSVWIKYLPRCPKFTAREWEGGITYNLDDLAYSPDSGECYKSKSSNNLGHDPSQSGAAGGPPQPLLVEETRGAQDNPGLAAQTKIIDVFATAGGIAIPPMPAAGSAAVISVSDASGAVLVTVSHTATGSEDMLAIFTNLASQLTAAAPLTGFTITLTSTPLSIRLVNASDFTVTATINTSFGIAYPIDVVQVQAYVPATAAVSGQGQTLKLSITEAQVVPGGTYLATFTTVDNVEHQAAYVALPTDNAQQILNGIINSTIALQGADPFFTSVYSTLDTMGPSATFTITQKVGTVSLHPVIVPPGAVYWEMVPFPFALVDQVVRGVIATVHGEQGQTDKKQAEEQVIPAESKLRMAAQTGNDYDVLSDQSRPHSRYSVKS